MKYFKNIFNNKKKTDSMESIQHNEIEEELFVDNSEPEMNSVAKPVNQIEGFLSKNYKEIGFRDGYAIPKLMIMEKYISTLTSQFQFLLSKEIDRLEAEKLKTISLLSQTKSLSQELTDEIQNTRVFQDTKINFLLREKENTSIEEGIVMKAINSYREGFTKGINVYTEELLLITNSGLFTHLNSAKHA